jgi:aspartate/methionine/tyrosine aminotransferase
MERLMSKFEQKVDYNLSESGVHPITLGELLGVDPVHDTSVHLERLLETELNYPYVNGDPELRQNIARLYDGATSEQVLVTVGAAEANNIAVRTLLAPGDEIVVMLPNYMQIWGIAKNHGYTVREFHLSEENGWAPDLAELEAALTAQTRLIAVCNPNNPTGRTLTEAEMDAIVACASKVGAWILADEVYRGANRGANRGAVGSHGAADNPSFYGRYDKVLAIGSMSKAYGLPGLRIGWIVGPGDTLDEIWARHEYVTISATMLANKLAALALSPEVRPRLIQRTRDYIRRGFPVLEAWMADHPGTFSYRPPDAAAIAFVRYHLDVNSTLLTERLRTEKSVLIVPGDHFGMDRFLRISFGLPHNYLVPALDRIHDLIVGLQQT